ncbi:MAG TPA: exodeoxyribonuclease III [Vicinamibacterales bacterium]|nr:exodeoxyribonuclease III [Vicinamibacterales bacterium]
MATWNVNGIRARHAQLEDWIARDRPDVVCLQEIKATPEQVPASLFGMQDYWCYWHGEKAYSGVGLHVSKAFAAAAPTCTHPAFNFENRIAAVDLKDALGDVTVASVYVPNGGKDYPAKLRFLEALDAYAASFQSTGRRLVICGDLNVAIEDRDVHAKERKAKAIGQQPEERALMKRILSRGLVDVQRQMYPGNDDVFTWWPPWREMRKRNIGWRIDYIFASAALAATVKACPVLSDIGTSDHAPVMATFE